MSCSTGSSNYETQRRARLEREYQAKLEAAQTKADGFERDLLKFLVDFKSGLNDGQDASKTSILPPIKIDTEQDRSRNDGLRKHYDCLHGSLFAFTLAANQPALFKTAGRFLGNGNGKLSGHLRYTFLHLQQIIHLRTQGRYGRMELENPEQRQIGQTLLRQEAENSVNALKIRMTNFVPSDVSGTWKMDSLLYHIGFNRGISDRYRSPFAAVSHGIRQSSETLLSPQTTAIE